MPSTQPETHAFQAETRELLDLMIHSLYTNREIFLRELVSNASDALDKLRFAALTDSSLRQGDDELRIRLEADPETRTLVVDDNGIGMSRDEVVQNLGTIARSGTKAFVEELKKSKAAEQEGAPPELIGQFGVGFYSSFMVADSVTVETRKAGSDEGVRWTSKGDGEFSVEACERETSGTRITLQLRAPESDATAGDQDSLDFTDTFTLRNTVKRYSDFVAYPIQMDVEREEGEGDEKKTVTSTETLNSMKPLWTRAKSEITDEEYTEFYKHHAHDWHDPLTTIHFRAEGTHEYTALMFVPTERPADIMDPTRYHSQLSLYVKRVFVMQECEELLPSWLRFVRGLVDSSDLPLNVSRETLQHNRQLKQIQSRLVKKVLDSLSGLLGDDRLEYTRFWASMGQLMKEGLFLDDGYRDDLAGICLFESSGGQAVDLGGPMSGADDPEAAEVCPFGYTTLSEYIARMPLAQKAIYYVTGPDRASVENSPHIEAARAKGYEVLFFVDHVDEWVLQRLTTFEEKPLRSLERGEDDLDEGEDETTTEERKEALSPLLGAAKDSLEDYVKDVRLTTRLKTSPAVLVTDEGGMSPQLEQALRAAGQQVPKQKRILELNPAHPVLGRLEALHSEGDETALHLHLELLHGQALLAEGSQVPDPARFAKLVTELMSPGTLGDDALRPAAETPVKAAPEAGEAATDKGAEASEGA